MAGRLLEKYGLTLADVELVPLGKVSAMMETLKSKQVDAVLLNEPNITAVVKEGYGKVIAQVGDEIEYQTSGLFFSQKFADNRDAAVRFMKAYVKASRYYYDAVLVQKDGKPQPGANYDEVSASLPNTPISLPTTSSSVCLTWTVTESSWPKTSKLRSSGT